MKNLVAVGLLVVWMLVLCFCFWVAYVGTR